MTGIASSSTCEVQDYLDLYFCDATELAQLAGIELPLLRKMIETGAAPRPSYIVLEGKLISAAFGELQFSGLRAGEYFRRAAASWIARAAQYGSDAEAADQFFDEFRSNLAAELDQANRKIARLEDAFDESGQPKPNGLATRLDAMTNAYSSGVFSICIADMESAEGIVRKEILQEKLQQFADSRESSNDAAGTEAMLKDISIYADSCMPFSPIEYPISSRKRLVEDLPRQLA